MARSISVVINTLNEEKHLPLALRSVRPWVDEIVVIDMYSSDRTVGVAREFGARVHLHRGPGFNFPPREFAVNQGTSEWVLMLDADELVPVALSRDLRHAAEADEADVLLLPRANYMLGSIIRHAGCGPEQDAQVRFFRKGFVAGACVAHQDFKPVAGARVKRLPFRGDNAIAHFTYLDSQQFIERLNHYTGIEAQQALERGERITPMGALRKGARTFLRRYGKKQGFRDGWRGLYLSLFYAFYDVATAAKLQELAAQRGRDAVAAQYLQEAEEILKAYGETAAVAPSRSISR